MMDNGNLSNI